MTDHTLRFPRLFFVFNCLALLLAVNSVQAADKAAPETGAQPHLVVKGDNQTLGPVIEGPGLSHTLILGNTGSAPLRILSLHPGKGTRILKAPEVVAPGKEACIELELTTLGRHGKSPAGVRLRSNDPDRPVRYLPLVLVVTPQISAVPDRFSLTGNVGSVLEGTITLKGNLAQALELKIARTELNTKENTVRLEKKSGAYILHLTSRPGEAGITRGKVVLTTNYPRYFRLTIPVMIRALAPLQALPATLSLGKTDLKAHCLVRSNDNKPFTVLSACLHPQIPGATTSITPVKPNSIFRIDITLPQLPSPLPPEITLEIHTDHPDQPVLKVKRAAH